MKIVNCKLKISLLYKLPPRAIHESPLQIQKYFPQIYPPGAKITLLHVKLLYYYYQILFNPVCLPCFFIPSNPVLINPKTTANKRKFCGKVSQ